MTTPNAAEREIARERIRYWSDHFLTTAISDDEIGALEEIFEKALADRREACARKAQAIWFGGELAKDIATEIRSMED